MNPSKVLVVPLAVLAIASFAYGKVGYGPGDQGWGFIDVREGAHMFYWLYYTTANVTSYTERPLAIWLQGGPGASSTGFGNFMELGPLDLYGDSRNSTWVKDLNVLFIDNPVGTGFSYVDHEKYLTANNSQIALDLVEFMKGFYMKHPEFVNVSLHIFSESYGGKMAPEFALELYYAIQRNEIICNLSSVALGDPWTSPIDSVLAWAPLLLNMGIVDQDGFKNIMAAANKTRKLVESEQWFLASLQWSVTQKVVHRESKGVDFYNIASPTIASRRMMFRSKNYQELMYRTLVLYAAEENLDAQLAELMQGPVTKALNISSNITWGSQSSLTFRGLLGDFMKPAIHIVEKLLNATNVKVGVFSGQLDLICATAGTVSWVDKLQWSHRNKYIKSPRLGIYVNGILEGYEKSAGNFSMFWINRAGHMVPADNPIAMEHIILKLTNQKTKINLPKNRGLLRPKD